MVILLPKFFAFLGERPGLMPPDPVLDRVGPHAVGQALGDGEGQLIEGLQRVAGAAEGLQERRLEGAAGALEAVVCGIALGDGLLPGSANTRQLDPSLRLDYLLASRDAPVKCAMNNSFGFGGSNCSLVFGKRA